MSKKPDPSTLTTDEPATWLERFSPEISLLEVLIAAIVASVLTPWLFITLLGAKPSPWTYIGSGIIQQHKPWIRTLPFIMMFVPLPFLLWDLIVTRWRMRQNFLALVGLTAFIPSVPVAGAIFYYSFLAPRSELALAFEGKTYHHRWVYSQFKDLDSECYFSRDQDDLLVLRREALLPGRPIKLDSVRFFHSCKSGHHLSVLEQEKVLLLCSLGFVSTAYDLRNQRYLSQKELELLSLRP